METQINGKDLSKKITNYLEELAKETDLARKSEAMKRYLEFAAKFHKYSPTNIMLILLAKPDASHVMGFNSWKKLNRFVKRGEHGIAIFAPLIHKIDSDDDNSPKVLSGFRIVYVFDVSQTEGDPLPPVPDWKSPEKNTELTEKLLKFAENKGIKVTFKDLPGDIQGVSKGGEIEIDFTSGVKTLLHEITHEQLHQSGVFMRSRATVELEAEATAYVVCRYFNVGQLNCSTYLSLYDVTSDEIMMSMTRVQKCASALINWIESKFTDNTII